MYVCSFKGHPGVFKNGVLRFINKQGKRARKRLSGCKRKIPGRPRRACPHLEVQNELCFKTTCFPCINKEHQLLLTGKI